MNILKRIAGTAPALLLLLAASCGPAKNSDAGSPLGRWEVLELKINSAETPAREEGETIVVTFEKQEEGGSYGVKALVNAYGGEFSWSEGSIEIMPGFGTLVVQTAYEDAFFDVFYGPGKYEVKGTELILRMNNGVIRSRKVE